MVLVFQSIESTCASGLLCCDEFVDVGLAEAAVVEKGVLEDIYDCLLERDDLGLKLVLGDDCTDVSKML